MSVDHRNGSGQEERRRRWRRAEKKERKRSVMEGVKPEDAIHVSIHICIESSIVLGTRVSDQREGGGRWGLVDDG